MKILIAKGGKQIQVSDAMFPLLSKHKWHLDRQGYAYTRLRQHNVRLHHFVCPQQLGAGMCDHIDGDKLNNQTDNLRLVAQGRNNFNKKVFNPSGLPTGVKRKGDKFMARINFDKKEHYLGLYATAEEAHTVRLAAEERLYGQTKPE